MMTYGLTPVQQKMLDFLKSNEELGLPTPTYEDMRKAVGWKSKCGVHRVLLALEERGAIKRLPFRARTVRVIDDRPSVPETPDTEPTQHEIIEMIAEARRHAKHAFEADDNECTLHIMSVWLWHAIRGTSPGFLAKTESQERAA